MHDLQSFADLTIVGHNVDFDIKVVGAELSRNGFGFDSFALPFICTMQIGKSVCRIPRASGNGYKYPTLQELYLNLFGRCFSDAHTSKADAEATARCFFELMRRGALPDLKTTIHRREPRDSKVMKNAKVSTGNNSAAGTPTQTAQAPDRAVVTNDYRKEEEGYRQHIKDIIREGVDKGGLLANSIEKEPKDPVPTRAASQTLEQVVSGNSAMPESAQHGKQAFPPIGTLDGCVTALVPGIRGHAAMTEEVESLLEFPCSFPIKAMGLAGDALELAVLEVVRRHAPDFDATTMEVRRSSAGRYLSLTCTINVISRNQLDALYRELSTHPLVRIVL